MKFHDMYTFQVFGAVEDGETVYIFDKKSKECVRATDLTVGEFVEVLRMAEDEKGRFVIWREEVEENA
jgi:hypothetical protein